MGDFTKVGNGALLAVGALLLLNGLINISDNGTVLAYDITSLAAGIGFGLVVFLLRRRR